MSPLSILSFRKGNLLFTFIIIGAVAVLMFIPDLIGLSTNSILDQPTNLNFSQDQIEESPSETKEIPDLEELQEEEVVPVTLDDISRLLNDEYYDQMIEEKVAQKQRQQIENRKQLTQTPIAQDEDDSLRAALNLPRLYAPEVKVNPDAPREITWKFLQSKPTRRKFADLQRQATQVALYVDPSAEKTKYAIYDYTTAMQGMAEGTQRFAQPIDAVNYLEQLDQRVLENMKRENVSRDAVIRWSEISLESAVGPRGYTREEVVPELNPQLKINDLSIITANPAPNSNADRVLHINFRVNGRELKTVDVLDRRTVVKTSYLAPEYENSSWKNGQFAGVKIQSGPLTFRVHDKYGNHKDYVMDFRPFFKIGHWEKRALGEPYELRFNNRGNNQAQFVQAMLDAQSGKNKDPFSLFASNGPSLYQSF